MWAEGVREQVAEESTWTEVEASNKSLEKTARYGVSWLLLLTKYYFGDKIQQDAIGGTCGSYKRREQREGLLWET